MIDVRFEQVYFSYLNGLVLQDINLSISPGEMVGFLGPNGSGKTTLLKLVSGILKPGRGEVSLGGTSLSRLSRRAVAHSVSVVPQYFHVPFAFTASEVVMLGRIPFLGAFTGETASDREVVATTVELVGIGGLVKRRLDEMSGGERQKVMLAMALAQQPKLLLLDEPTAHLDISHQVEILELVRSLNVTRGLTVMAAMHDLNLASLYFDRLILLKEGRILADGSPAQVLTEDSIEQLFSTPVRVELEEVTGRPHIVVLPRRSKKLS